LGRLFIGAVNSEFADQARDHDPSVARVKVLGGGGG
jgi:hypothetical protein